MVSKIVILDGYTDEPAGFGVPPYIDVYPRYLAGAIWSYDPSITIHYLTVDWAREHFEDFLKLTNKSNIVVVVAGAVVPGKYLGGTPINVEELKTWFRLIDRPLKLLVGPAALYGFGNEGGGYVKALPKDVKENFDVIVTGDPDLFIYTLLREGLEKAEPWRRWDNLEMLDLFAVKGARIVEQHPNYGYNLTAELETYRGCTRFVSGGCSFCVTKNYGRVLARPPKSIVREVEALYKVGVRHFRLGRQSDILVYGSKELGVEEWPKPDPSMLERLFHGIRVVAPSLKTLHIDNVNPGTLVHHEKESIEALKTIVRYHTPGDVAALGIESVDPRVVKLNNLKVDFEGAIKAVEIVNRVGRIRGYNGLPELLPGINFVLGLPGETAETFKLNLEFLEELLRRNLLVRRINVRQVLILPATRLWDFGDKLIKKHRKLVRWFKSRVQELSRLFLERVVPRGTIIRGLYIERYMPSLGVTFARQAGSYPIVAEIPCKIAERAIIDVVVYGYSGRSVRALPLPLDANRVPLSIAAKIVGKNTANKLALNRPYKTVDALKRVLGKASVYFDLNGHVCIGT